MMILRSAWSERDLAGGEGVKVKIGGGGCWSGGRYDDNICALIVLLIKMTATLVYTKCSR